MRPIDADSVLRQMMRGYELMMDQMADRSAEVRGAMEDARLLFTYAVHDATTLDVVPVIRCRECKHKSQGISDKMRTWCSMWQCWILQGDGYCHMAAKIDAGQEDDENA